MRLLLFLLLCTSALLAQNDLPPTESDYYSIVTIPVPEGILLEVGGLVTLPNGSVAASTRRGDVYIVDNPDMADGKPPRFRRFARGMHECLGLAYKDGDLYAAQRGELTRLRDTDGDGRADEYKSIYQVPLTGNYHEYTYGPKIAADGSMYITANVGFFSPEWWRGKSYAPWRGWAMRITPDGDMEPFAAGMRSPCGIGMVDGEFFYADNQGDWIGSGGLVHVEKGDFVGHPASLAWAGHPASPVDISLNDIYYRVPPRLQTPGAKLEKPEDIEDEKPTPLFAVAKEVPAVKTPAVWLPHSVLGISNAELLVDTTGGAFGPFAGQVFIGDQGQSKIMRVAMEKVKGEYQGVAFKFREGFQSGILRMSYGPDGSLYVGQTNRGWGSAGTEDEGLQRLVWSGRTPFEMKTIKAMPDGFEIEFTQPVDKATASDPDSYVVSSFIYKYHPVYGSPAVNIEPNPVWAVQVSKDGRKARILVDDLRENYIHEIKAPGVRSYADGYPVLHETGYYTLKNIPDGPKLDLPRPAPTPVAEMQQDAHKGHDMAAMTAVESPDDPDAQVAVPTAPKVNQKPVPSPVPKAKTPAKTPPAPRATSSSKRPTRKPAAWDAVDQTIVLATLPGMRYDRTNITVKAGSRIKWSFYNNDDMPHNVVIVAPGTVDEVGKQALAMGVQGMAKNYIPDTDAVLYHTRLMPPGTDESLYFTAPDKPGTYMYVCTFPGHAQVMRGTLRVL